MSSYERSVRRAAVFVLTGLAIQLGMQLYWSPLTFVLFAVLGVPPVLIGVGLCLAAVLRYLKERKAL